MKHQAPTIPLGPAALEQNIRRVRLVSALGRGLVAGYVMSAAELVATVLTSPLWFPLFLFNRVTRRKPWVVEAFRLGSRTRRRWEVCGWRESSEVIAEVVSDIAAQRSPRPQIHERLGSAVPLHDPTFRARS